MRVRKETEVVAALIRDGDRFLVCQRPGGKGRAMQWEFVGGKVEPGETKEQALLRECREELDIVLDVGDEFAQLTHSYPDITIHLTVFQSAIAQGRPKLLEHSAMGWVTPEEAECFDLCPADREILKQIKKERPHGKRTHS